METALFAIVAVACPLGMLLMGIMMWKGMGSKRESGGAGNLEELRAEHRRLGGEIERRERAENGASMDRVGR